MGWQCRDEVVEARTEAGSHPDSRDPAVFGQGLRLGVSHRWWNSTRLKLHEDERSMQRTPVRGERLLPVIDHRRLEAFVIDGLAAVFLPLVPEQRHSSRAGLATPSRMGQQPILSALWCDSPGAKRNQWVG